MGGVVSLGTAFYHYGCDHVLWVLILAPFLAVQSLAWELSFSFPGSYKMGTEIKILHGTVETITQFNTCKAFGK